MSEEEGELIYNASRDFSCSSLNSSISILSEESSYDIQPSSPTEQQHGSHRTNIKSKTSIGFLMGYNNLSIIYPTISLLKFKNSEHPQPTKKLEAASEDKEKEYNALMELVHKAEIEYKINKFLIECAKVSEIKTLTQVKKSAQKVFTNSTIEEKVQLKDKNGETFNVLGLPDENVVTLKETTLSPLEKIEFSRHMTEVVKYKVQELKMEKQKLFDTFGKYERDEKPGNNTVLTETQDEYLKIMAIIPDQVTQGIQLLNSISEQMIELATLKAEGRSEELESLYYSIHLKAEFLSVFMRKLKVQNDQQMLNNQKFNKALNSFGDRIKTLIEETRYKLNKLEKNLAEYEEKQNKSKKYEKIVEEYSKTAKALQHQMQTLSILSENSEIGIK